MRLRPTLKIIVILWCFSPLVLMAQEKSAIDLEGVMQVKYNNPGLKTDLGVGLLAWPLPIDFDGDGDMDLLVSSGERVFNGLYYFENTSGKSPAVFDKPVRIGDGLRSVQISYVNNEPYILGPGIEFTNFKNKLFKAPEGIFPVGEVNALIKKGRFSEWRYVDYDNDGDLDLLVGGDDWSDYGWDNAYDDKGNWKNGPLHGYVILIENVNGKYQIKRKLEAGGKPIDVYGTPSPNMYDFDDDGDLDLICGEFLDKLTWFENIGTREKPAFAPGRFLENEKGIIRMDLQMIMPTAVDWDGDGDIDLVVGEEDGRVALLENTGKVENHMPGFKSPVYFKQEADNLKFGALVTPFSIDWDGDGDADLICGNTAGNICFIENLDNGNPPKWNAPVLLEADGKPIRIQAGKNGSIQGPCEAKWGYTTLSVADWDGDGLNDIIINSIWGKIEWFKNVGTKIKPRLSTQGAVKIDWGKDKPQKPQWNWWIPGKDELVTQWRTTPFAIDWNHDGLMDLVMLDHEGYLAYFERFKKKGQFWLHPGKRIFMDGDKDSLTPLRLNDKIAGQSGRRKICLVDWDNDGDLDLLVDSNNTAWYENIGTQDGKTVFTFRGDLMRPRLAGHTTSPTTVDWNKDELPELLLGAEDGHFYYLPRNTK